MGGEIPLPEKDAIEAHLSECHGCRSQVQELRRVNQHVEEAVESAEASDELAWRRACSLAQSDHASS